MTSAAQHVLVGTAGHIDHGKTRLVGRLTGIDTDRLPEEKARGISIDLGFAHWESDGVRFGVVDVPGHERFVKNMVAGATGVNIALLVVAADDGVMPQTREHLDIMDLLGIRAGAVAITKIDLVEPDFVELVQAEIEELTAGTFLEGCPIVCVSSETGKGIEELRTTLARIAAATSWAEASDFFRMPVDRVFSITGHGTVATGSVLSGEVRAGDMLDLLPQGREVRVRSVEIHGTSAADSGARRRTAINLAGLKQDEIARGMELATPGRLRPSRRLLVELRALKSSPLVLKNRMELNLHLATSEAPARLILKDQPLKPGQRCYAELRTREPVVAAWGQRFILRRASPQVTVAGGTVIDPAVPIGKRVRDPQGFGAALHSPSERERLAVFLSERDAVDEEPFEAAWRAGVRSDRYRPLVEELKQAGTLGTAGARDRRLLVHAEKLARLKKAVMRTVREELQRHQPRRALPKSLLVSACRSIAGAALLDAIFTELVTAGELVEVGDNLGPADAQVRLTKKQQQARDQMLQSIRTAGLAPPTSKELAAAVRMPQEEVEPLLNLCVEDGLLVRVADGMYFTPEALESARATCRALLEAEGAVTLSQMREAWGVSRKFAVPLGEHFDATGVTLRDGDLRRAGPNMGP
ncbi:MAG: selenocysteine-specific translation elongation factor [Planctomycetes bacterium]|nr:selenocysteine-specific translation elongation factor [Planctomycetota bacterium]